MIRRIAPFLLVSFTLACARPNTEPPLPPVKARGDGPSLVMLLVVDQLRADYMVRFRPLFNGGLAWLLDNGAAFQEGRHDHSATETAPGHAALATGAHPANSGIAGNNWYEVATATEMYSGGSGSAVGPGNLRVPALGDWMKAADRRTKVFSASRKDRSAIMMGGRNPDGAYWYDWRIGGFRSAPYYGNALRSWLLQLNDERLLDRFFGLQWYPLEGAPEPGQYDIVQVDTGAFGLGFPHAVGPLGSEPGPLFYSALGDTPYVDWYVAELGKRIIEAEQLGADGNVDLLALSFSATDSVGHDYGPDSPEVVDTLRRLDATLMDLIEYVDATVGLEHVVIALSSDHGVVPLPELLRTRGIEARRLGAEDYRCVQQAGETLRQRLGDQTWFVNTLEDAFDFYVNPDAVGRSGVSRSTVEREMAAILEACDALQKVWTADEIMALQDPEPGSIEALLRHSYVPDRSPHLILQLKPNYVSYQGMGTSHGSVYGYDTRVPIIFAGAGIRPATIEGPALTVDVAPTLADLIGVVPPPSVDGRSLVPRLPTAR